MTSADIAPPAAARLPGLSAREQMVLTVMAGFALCLALCAPRVADIWTTGNFYDSDDAMRMVEVRDFLGGQGWYDLTQWRLDPPQGSFMHWSRVVDLPLALLLRCFQLFATGEVAERLARICFPLCLQATLLAGSAWLGRILFGDKGVAPVVALTVLSGFMLGQFVPGRVDHHSAQIILLVLMTASMASALCASRARMAAVSATCIAVSLSISIENLLFICAVFAAPPLLWIARGRLARPLLLWFAGGLAVAIPLCFALFNAPSRWSIASCDAFSASYVAIAFGAALLSAGLAAARRFEATIAGRLCAAGALGALIGAPLLAWSGHCLIDPFEGLDPAVRDIWLSNVGEARTALRHFALFPKSIQTILLPALLGLAGLAVAIAQSRHTARDRFIFLFALSAMGCLGTAFMIRAATSLAPLVLTGCAYFVVQLGDWLVVRKWQKSTATAVALCATLPLSQIGWAMAPALYPERADAGSGPKACLEASSFAPLARLPAGLALASIEAGAYILEHTPHSVVTASYHRNNHGNRLAIDAFSATPAAAQAIVAASGAQYIFVCGGNKELAIIAARAPESLAAALLKGEAPVWLRPVQAPETPYRVYAVK